jgi:hypothetical protein
MGNKTKMHLGLFLSPQDFFFLTPFFLPFNIGVFGLGVAERPPTLLRPTPGLINRIINF